MPLHGLVADITAHAETAFTVIAADVPLPAHVITIPVRERKTVSYNDKINMPAEKLTGFAAFVIGAASGMSASAGFRHYYERDNTFLKYFGEFEKKYGYHNTFDGFYYRYHDKLFSSTEIGHRLNNAINADLKVPSGLIPHCPECGAQMEPWVRSFVFLDGRKYVTVNPKDACLPLELSDKGLVIKEDTAFLPFLL